MQTHWLNRQQHGSCILFVSGWGMDPSPFQSIRSRNHDVLMVYDYQELSPPLLTELQAYNKVHLVAWSMGVWISGVFFSQTQERFSSITAIGGTLTPFDDSRGIPLDNLKTMLQQFSPAILTAFYESMFDDPRHRDCFLAAKPARTETELLQELQHLYHSSRETPAFDIFSQKIITARDRVFPARNQLRAWGKKESNTVSWPHFPFYQADSWEVFLP